MKNLNIVYYIKYIILITLLCNSNILLGQKNLPQKEIAYVIYGFGNYGNNQNYVEAQRNLDALRNKIHSESKNTAVIFLGNNASKKGFLKNDLEWKKIAEQNLSAQIKILDGFNGKSIFIPGNDDWNSEVSTLKAQSKFIKASLGKGNFLPKNECPIERIEINEVLDLVILDSYWAMMDWDKYPGINRHCDIKNKEEFYIEVESNIKKGEGKTVIVAMSHPVNNFGKFGAHFSFGIDPKDLSNPKYKEFSERMTTIARQVKNVVFLSAHENNLQYSNENDVPSIISGSGAIIDRVSEAKSTFSSSQLGFSKLTFYKDGSVWVSFYESSNNYSESVFDEEIKAHSADNYLHVEYNEYNMPKTVNASIYEEDELKHSTIFKAIWGAHYRKDYITKVEAKTALLDTLYGGLRPLRKGGGHQTNSLRLINPDGKEFVMRSVKKSALRFIQYFLFKTEYLEPDTEETYFLKLLQDYWTTANPYGLLTIGDLSDALGILHANPELYYVPKQKVLGSYNEKYGDKLYFIEERLTKGQEGVASLGRSDKIISTQKLLKELRQKKSLEIDEKLYIRTRIFDNLIGDWDRHADQWKWAKYVRNNDSVFYKPIPRDRDQVFSDFDGPILRAITALTPPLRFMQRYDGTYDHVKWYNDAGDDVDIAVLKNHTRNDWIKEAKFIKKTLTEDIIDNAFSNIPKEVNQEKLKEIRIAFGERLDNIEKNASEMYDYLSRSVLITGTDKKDFFEIERLSNGKTHVKAYHFQNSIKGDKFWDVVYDSKNTKEIWIYGLDKDDTFHIGGKGNRLIHIKIIGGYGNDTYSANNSKNIKVYDYKSKKNTFTTKVPKMLSDNADMNTYYYKKNRRDLSSINPLLGFDPDDGLGLGFQYNYQKNSLIRNPFTDEHHIGLTYYFQTSSVEAFYLGEFAHVFDKVNFGLEIEYSSPGYTDNFFGFGNDTPNLDNDLGFDFNRVRTEKFSVLPSLIFRGYQGSEVRFGLGYESFEIEKTTNRFITQAALPNAVFDSQDFFRAELTYIYDNLKESVISKSGIGWGVSLGYKTNLDNDHEYSYVIPHIKIATKLDKRGRLVFASKVESQLNFGNDFEFYQAATLGAGQGLRGYRLQRFSGKRSFAHSSDLRLSLGRLRNAVLPITMGVYGGFDYGRVWVRNDNSNAIQTSYGGGMYFSLSGFSALNLAYFGSNDGGRFTFGLSLPF